MGGKSIGISSGDSGENQRLENRPPPAENGNGISSLAHEINNPLEALHQLHYLIEREGTLREKGRQYLALARDEVRRISQILHAAMELRDSGDPEDTDVPELLRSVLNFYKSRFDSQEISVNTRYRSGAHLSAYPHQLRQMCANLLLNAADAMPSGGKIYARIAPAHEWKGDHKPGLRLTFADTGSGITSKKSRPHLGPVLYHQGSRGQRHWTFTGQKHRAETPWHAPRPQQHQSGS